MARQLPVGISLVDVEHGQIVFANTECARIFGYSQDELSNGGITYIDLTHPEDRDRNLVEHHRMLNGETEQYRLRSATCVATAASFGRELP